MSITRRAGRHASENSTSSAAQARRQLQLRRLSHPRHRPQLRRLSHRRHRGLPQHRGRLLQCLLARKPRGLHSGFFGGLDKQIREFPKNRGLSVSELR